MPIQDTVNPTYTSPEPMDRAPAARRRGASRVWLVALLALMATGAAAGTWASFTASTTNTGTFATGALVLSDKVGSGTACLSIGADPFIDSNANAACGALLAVDLAKPGDSASAAVVLENVGNIAASSLQAHTATPCATTDSPSTSFNGVADICSAVQLTIQSYASQGNLDADIAAGGTCLYGADGDHDGACDGFSAATTLATFATDYPSFSNALPLGAIPASAPRYYRLSVRLDPTVGNSAMGRRATFGITWRMVQ
jgi:hypothetical protein